MPAPPLSPGGAAESAPTTSTDPDEVKKALRRTSASGRRVLAEDTRRRNDESRTTRVLSLVREQWPAHKAVIGCYLSISPEPDTLALVALLQSMGHEILAPVLSRRAGTGAPRPVAWARYEGPASLTPGFHAIPEPKGEVLRADALLRADLVIASGLAGGLDGSRVGTGGGWFDRALTSLPDGAPVWLLLNDSEVHASIPQQAHDHPISTIVTPTRTLRTTMRE